MKKTLAVLAVAATMLSGCSSATPEEQYISELRAELFDGETYPDRSLLSVGAAACSAIQAGVSENELAKIAERNGLTAREGRAIATLAKKYLCEGANGS